MKYTKHGYYCSKCFFNFRFDLTSPVSRCPKCGAIINDKLAYYFCRAGRALGAAIIVSLIVILLELFYMPKTFPVISLVVIALATVVFYVKQMWSLIVSRIITRVTLFLLIALIVFGGIAWVLSALNIYKIGSPQMAGVVAAAIVAGLVLSVVSLVFFHVKDTTYEYIP